MSGGPVFDELRNGGFDVATFHHAEAILKHDMPAAVDELTKVLSSFSIPVDDLVRGGGGEAESTQRMRRDLDGLGWHKHEFVVQKIVDGMTTRWCKLEERIERRVGNPCPLVLIGLPATVIRR